jgi:hypothetical protein
LRNSQGRMRITLSLPARWCANSRTWSSHTRAVWSGT